MGIMPFKDTRLRTVYGFLQKVSQSFSEKEESSMKYNTFKLQIHIDKPNRSKILFCP
jgi:hypothetical protein